MIKAKESHTNKAKTKGLNQEWEDEEMSMKMFCNQNAIGDKYIPNVCMYLCIFKDTWSLDIFISTSYSQKEILYKHDNRTLTQI